MPALPNYPQVLRLRYLWTIGIDLSASTTLHYSYTGTAPTNGVCDTLASDIYANAVTHLIPLVQNHNALVGMDVTDLTSDTAGNGNFTGTTAGTRGAEVLPAEVCLLNGLLINRRYRGGKPRSYWPFGVPGDLDTSQQWSSGAISDFFTGLVAHNNYCSSLLESGTQLTQLVSISYYKGFLAVQNPITGRWRNVPTVRSAAITPDPVYGFVPNPKPGSQRRRSLHSS